MFYYFSIISTTSFHDDRFGVLHIFAKSLHRKRGMKIDQGSFRLDIIVASLRGVIRLKILYTRPFIN